MEELSSQPICICNECTKKTFLSFPKLCDIDVCLNHLTEVDLSSSNISKLPYLIGNLVNIVNLNLSSNKLETLPQALTKFDHLTDLNLSNNNFKLVPQCLIDGMSSVSKLDLSHNNLLHINKKPFCIQRLVNLNISYNSSLESLPNWLWSIECISLKFLDISFTNCLMNVESDPYLNMYGISNHLENLNISDTNSDVLKLDFIKHLKKLKTLVVDNKEKMFSKQNWFNNVPLVFNYRFKSITCLSMSNVCLTNIGDKLYFSLPYLRILNLSKNYIAYLPDTLSELKNLEVCDFSNNQILIIPECFKDLTNLKRLILNNNDLSTFPHFLEDLPNLEYLDLYCNNIIKCPQLNLNSNIKSIDLERNIFSTKKSIDQNSIVHYEKMLNNLRLSINENRMTGSLICTGAEDDAEPFNDESSTSSSWWSSEHNSLHNTNEELEEAVDIQPEEYWDDNSYEMTTGLFDPKEFEVSLLNDLKMDEPLTLDEKSNEKRIIINAMRSCNEHYFCPHDEHTKILKT
ncbi:Leucine-rich repeat,Leucine-rich repeat domain, L domain-like,Leucine-rich repeat, typical subtype [Cinara cedri]|uniref:Leucine-rich repeat,Leucine-rich repeat domain, L domain-like,Leucine-rich repeat, typical subtype n=1 Tax=Cinara cedri TaxID=506608 RepID=A0A5E4NQS5_9HEMI|nr:Leucine-rich repeat,Leucine-rich repeat domain, L domain-like,Leucine-rich repeat, typical subtype [Cinara cedri]